MQIAESRLHYDYALTMHSAIHTGCSLVGVRDRFASGKLISEVGQGYYLFTDAYIIWDDSGADTFCRMCGGCADAEREGNFNAKPAGVVRQSCCRLVVCYTHEQIWNNEE